MRIRKQGDNYAMIIHHPKSGKPIFVGNLFGKSFVRRFSTGTAKMFALNAFSFDARIVRHLRRSSIEQIVFVDDKQKTAFGIPFRDFLKKSFRKNNGEGDQLYIEESDLTPFKWQKVPWLKEKTIKV